MDIKDIGLSFRSYNALLRHGIKTKDQLEKMSTMELFAVRNFGPKCFEDVKRVLGKPRSMKIVCDCGELTEFVDGEDGPSHTVDEGWYKVTKGNIGINNGHDQVFFVCKACGNEIWIFT